ncbi:hypothetical protein H0H87_001270 [Tephrocybe sp. NHM501043]|nr:hypothetical protein H0H87_001270 [Tephrocybe sp. NHM501043]
MVGAINAPSSGNLTFKAFQGNAKSFQGPSGQGEGSLVGHGASASAGPGPEASGVSFYTGAPATSATAPGSPSDTASAGGASGGGAGGGNGTMGVAVNWLVVAFSMVLGAFVCLG